MFRNGRVLLAITAFCKPALVPKSDPFGHVSVGGSTSLVTCVRDKSLPFRSFPWWVVLVRTLRSNGTTHSSPVKGWSETKGAVTRAGRHRYRDPQACKDPSSAADPAFPLPSDSLPLRQEVRPSRGPPYHRLLSLWAHGRPTRARWPPREEGWIGTRSAPRGRARLLPHEGLGEAAPVDQVGATRGLPAFVGCRAAHGVCPREAPSAALALEWVGEGPSHHGGAARETLGPAGEPPRRSRIQTQVGTPARASARPPGARETPVGHDRRGPRAHGGQPGQRPRAPRVHEVPDRRRHRQRRRSSCWCRSWAPWSRPRSSRA